MLISCLTFRKIIPIIILLMLLVSCQMKSYPKDYEQLSDEERIVIRLSHVVGENTPKGLASRYFAEKVKERTDGYVEVQVFPNSKLYKDGEELDALIDGDIQMIIPATSKITPLVPEWQVIDLPFAFADVYEIYDYLGSPAGKVLKKKLEEEGMYPLVFWDNGFKQMTNNENPLHKPEDFTDLQFRVMSSEVLVEQFALLDADAKIETFDQVFSNLEKEKVNAQENTFSNIVNKNMYDVQEYITVSNHGYLGYLVLMNADFWHSLPDDIQVIILDVLDETTEWEIEVAQEVNEESYQVLKDCHCIDIHELNKEEQQSWEEALEPLYDYFAERYGAQYIEYLPKYETKKEDKIEDE